MAKTIGKVWEHTKSKPAFLLGKDLIINFKYFSGFIYILDHKIDIAIVPNDNKKAIGDSDFNIIIRTEQRKIENVGTTKVPNKV